MIYLWIKLLLTFISTLCWTVVVKIQNMQQPFGLHIHRNTSCVELHIPFCGWTSRDIIQVSNKLREGHEVKLVENKLTDEKFQVGSWNKSHSESHILNWISRGIWRMGYIHVHIYILYIIIYIYILYIWGLDLPRVITCHYLWSLQAVKKNLPLLRQAIIDEVRTQHHWCILHHKFIMYDSFHCLSLSLRIWRWNDLVLAAFPFSSQPDSCQFSINSAWELEVSFKLWLDHFLLLRV